MIKKLRNSILILFIFIFLQSPAMAIYIVDQDLTDDNYITSVSSPGLGELGIGEDYNELYLVPYPSHDGLGIVNERGGYFDKVLTFEPGDMGVPWWFTFEVLNTGPFTWSDYHFEFWDSDFNQRLMIPDALSNWSSDIFTNSSFDGSILQFWAPNWVSPGETDIYHFFLNPDFLDIDGGSIGIRQVATTIPEPMSMALFGLGLLGLARLSRRKK